MSLMRDKPFLAPGQRAGKRGRGRGRRREELSRRRLPQVRWDCRRAKKTQASSAKVKERNRVTGPQVGTDAQVHRTAYDAVGRWLTNHPAPLWLVNNPAKKWVATRSAGNYDREVVRSTLASLVGEDAVVVFSATYCPFSLAAKRTLAAQGVQFKVIEWNKRDDGAALVAELGELTGRTSIPHIFLGGLSIGGFNDGTPGLRPLISSGGFGGALEQARRRRAAGKARQVAIFGQAREEGA